MFSRENESPLVTFALELLFVDLFDMLGGQKSLFSNFALKIIFMLNYVSCLLKNFCLTLSDRLKKPEKSKVTEVKFLQKVIIFCRFLQFFCFLYDTHRNIKTFDDFRETVASL